MNKNKDVNVRDSLDVEIEELLEEVSRINGYIKDAKTNLKKEYYKKKLDKLKQKTYKSLLCKASSNPELLRRTEEEHKDE